MASVAAGSGQRAAGGVRPQAGPEVRRSERWAALFDGVITGGDGNGVATAWVVEGRGPAGVLSWAGGRDGLGRPVEPESRFHVYCAIKPLLAMAVGVLVDQRELSLDDRVGHLVGCGPPVAALTVAELLEHRSGLHQPGPLEAALLSGDELRRRALGGGLVEPPLGPGESYYTEAVAWVVVAEVVRAVLEGEPLVGFVRTAVLEPLGLDDHFDLGDRPDDGRFRVNVSVRRRRWATAMMQEVTPMLAWDANPGFGGRATVAGLVGLADETTAALQGEGRVLRAGTASELVDGGCRRVDRAQGRAFTFGRGWMRDLGDQRFGPAVGPGAFGHAGLLGMTAYWSDPETGISGGFHLNGLSDEATMLDWLRPTLVSAITANVSEPGGEASPTGGGRP